MKFLMLIVTCFCTALVFAEAAGVGLLMARGQLSMQTLRDIQLAVNGDKAEETHEESHKDTPEVSLDEVISARARMSVEFNAKESELADLKTMMLEGTARLTAQQAAFEKRKKAFEKELEDARKQVTDEATTQARGILMALPPKDAVERLIQLNLEDAVVLLKGMPEKQIAKILKEFKGDDQAKRGKEIFDALNRGEPVAPVVDRARNAMNQPSALDGTGANR